VAWGFGVKSRKAGKKETNLNRNDRGKNMAHGDGRRPTGLALGDAGGRDGGGRVGGPRGGRGRGGRRRGDGSGGGGGDGAGGGLRWREKCGHRLQRIALEGREKGTEGEGEREFGITPSFNNKMHRSMFQDKAINSIRVGKNVLFLHTFRPSSTA